MERTNINVRRYNSDYSLGINHNYDNYDNSNHNDIDNIYSNKDHRFSNNYSNQRYHNNYQRRPNNFQNNNFNKNHRNNRFNSNQNHQQFKQQEPKWQNGELLNIKTLLARYITKNIDLTTFKYVIAEYKHDLEPLNNGKYYISPNYNGNLCLAIFVKIANKYYSYTVDKKTLTKNIQNNIGEIKITKLNIRLDESVYNGTILDCTVINNFNNNARKNIVINDVYMFCGNNLMKDSIYNKLLNIEAYLKSMNNDDVLNDVTFMVNKLYNLYDIKQLISTHIPNSKFKTIIKGVTFYSQYNYNKIIYLFSNSNKSSDDDQKQTIIRKSNVSCNDDDIIAYFRIKKTNTPDVYHLYLKKKSIKDGKKFIRLKKFCIAYIPSIDVSYFCKDLFKVNDDTNMIIVKCKYDKNKNKWIPQEHAKDKRYPDSYKIVEQQYNNNNDDSDNSD